MGIASDISDYDWDAALAALAWQADLGVTEVIGDLAVDRYDLPAAATPMPALQPASPQSAPAFVAPQKVDTVALATRIAAACPDLAALHAAMAAFDHCELKKGAHNLVFSDGNPAARLMIIGEAPGRDEDIEGRPFVGRAGQLLDRMLAAIGLSRTAEAALDAAYITNVMPWRPPGNRDPEEEEIAMMRPFLVRHIAIVKPAVIIVTGNTACAALLGKRGISRLRGHWAEAEGVPVMPMTHPAYLLRNPAAKRGAWADLLAVKAKLGAL